MSVPYFPILLLALVALGGCAESEAPQKTAPLVRVQSFAGATMEKRLSYPGEILPRHQSKLGFQVGGRLLERKVEVGEQVAEGALLAVLDSRDYDLDSEHHRQRVAAAQAELAQFSEDLQRVRRLVHGHFASQAELDAAIHRQTAARAALEALRAQHGESLNRQGYTTLKSPRAGVVTEVLVEAGAVLAAGQPVVRLAWDGGREMATAIPESHIGRLRVGQTVSLRVWALDDLSLSGVIREISPQANPRSRTYQVRVRLLDPPPDLRLGMSGTLDVAYTQERPGAVPATALIGMDKQPAVYVIDPDTLKASVRIVSLGPPEGDGVSILDGIGQGQLVVVAGAGNIKGGQRVRLLQQ